MNEFSETINGFFERLVWKWSNNMEADNVVLIQICILCLSIIAIFIILHYFVFSPSDRYFSFPNSYASLFPPLPHITIKIDISGRRGKQYENYIDEWINLHYWYDFNAEIEKKTKEWEEKSKRILNDYHTKLIDKAIFFKKYKAEKYREISAAYSDIQEKLHSQNYKSFYIIFYRNQTRYRQCNYQKQSYIVQQQDGGIAYSTKELSAIKAELKKWNFELTRSQYYSKNQRSLMTPELRKKIMIRDNYTCQKCGKYMPDKVGLHVDHIVPVSKGGKTIESNLQVLCDRCNHKKYNKTDDVAV